MFALTFKK